MNRETTFSVAAIGLLTSLTLTATVSAGQLVVGSDRDNTLYEEVDGGLSNGAGNHFFAGRTLAFGLRRGVIHFDVSGIPPGSSVDSVELRLNLSNNSSGAASVALHAATADWGEGTSSAGGPEGGGATSTPGDATWIHTFFPGSFWASVGGDFVPAASAATVVNTQGFYIWGSTAGLEADVQAWVDDPSQNFGWVVVGDEAGQTSAKRFDTRESGPSVEPVLTVNWGPAVPVELLSFSLEED